jgi:iron transport multicopper oxidase
MAGHWPSTPAIATKGKCGTNGANVIDIPEDAESIEITIVNLSPIAHSFHLHGMYFEVVNYGYPEWCNRKNQWVCFFLPYLAAKEVAHETIGGKVLLSDPEHPDMGGPFYWGIEPNKEHPNYKKTLNLEAPLRKDVIGLWMHQWAVIRIKPNNPGMWPLHCHVEHHIPTGMVAALNVKPSLQPAIPLDTPVDGSCPVNGWPHRQAPEPKKISTSLDVYDWVVDYQRPTREGKGWFAKRLNPNEIEPNHVASLLLANGSFPGAPIEVMEGDLVTIEVNNHAMSSGLTVHGHGLAMTDTPWSDGAYGITQGAITPSNSFKYSFRAEPAGTHMFVGATDAIVGARGLKGALIVRPRTEPRAHLYDEEMTMHISDSWQTPDVCLGYDGVNQLPLCPPVERITFDGMWGDGSIEYPLPVYKVKRDSCSRMRIIGAMSQVGRLILTIEGHTFKLLAVDGADVVPVELSSLALHAGERYDVLLCADQKRALGKRRFEITASAGELCDPVFLARGGFPAPETCFFRAVLEHVGGLLARGGEQVNSSSAVPALDLSYPWGYNLLKPLDSPPELQEQPDASFELTLGALPDGRAFLHTSATPWSSPSSPLLFTQGLECSEGAPLITVPVEARDIELTVRNSLAETQTVHLHGPRFQLIAIAINGTAEPLETPILRDTVAVPGGGAVVMRVSTEVPGMWALEAMSANLRHRGASTVLSVRASQVTDIPNDVPVQGPCIRSEQFV